MAKYPCLTCGANESGSIPAAVDFPFRCKTCGAIDFEYRAVRDVVFVYPDPVPDKIGSLYVPDEWKELGDYGTVLSVGKGYYDKKGKFHPTLLKAGQRVLYDKTIPWSMVVEGADGKKHEVKYMGEQDVKAIVEEAMRCKMGPYTKCRHCGKKLGKKRGGPFGELCERCSEPGFVASQRV